MSEKSDGKDHRLSTSLPDRPVCRPRRILLEIEGPADEKLVERAVNSLTKTNFNLISNRGNSRRRQKVVVERLDPDRPDNGIFPIVPITNESQVMLTYVFFQNNPDYRKRKLMKLIARLTERENFETETSSARCKANVLLSEVKCNEVLKLIVGLCELQAKESDHLLELTISVNDSLFFKFEKQKSKITIAYYLSEKILENVTSANENQKRTQGEDSKSKIKNLEKKVEELEEIITRKDNEQIRRLTEENRRLKERVENAEKQAEEKQNLIDAQTDLSWSGVFNPNALVPSKLLTTSHSGAMLYRERLTKGKESKTFVIKQTKWENSERQRRELKAFQSMGGCREIVTLYGFKLHSGAEANCNFIYLLLEDCDCNLKEALNKGLPSLNVTVLQVLRDASRGLDHLSLFKIVHKDIKLQNILISRLAGYRRRYAKIADFNLAKRLNDEGIASQSGSGTKGWMPKDEILTAKYDVYGMGCVFICTITNDSLDDGLVLRSGPLKPFSKLEHKIREAEHNDLKNDFLFLGSLQRLIEKMLLNDYKERPSTAEVLCHCALWDFDRARDFFKKLRTDIRDKTGIKKMLDDKREERNWPQKLGEHFERAAQKFAEKGSLENDFSQLIRFIVNKHEHYQELSSVVKEKFESSDVLLAYFLSRFPNLLVDAWEAIRGVEGYEEFYEAHLYSD